MYNEEGEVIAGKDEYLSPSRPVRNHRRARRPLFLGIVLAECSAGRNIFEGESPNHAAKHLDMPLPDFTKLARKAWTRKLNVILHKALCRPRPAIPDSRRDAHSLRTLISI